LLLVTIIMTLSACSNWLDQGYSIKLEPNGLVVCFKPNVELSVVWHFGCSDGDFYEVTKGVHAKDYCYTTFTKW
jgi:hypothetical protein